jgi:hypothetical protein
MTDILLQGWGRKNEHQLLKGSLTSLTCIDRKSMEIKRDKRLVLIGSDTETIGRLTSKRFSGC